jgi:hypothetical protein
VTATRVLFDTNIFISREDNRVVPEALQALLRTANTLNAQILLHPLSVEDVRRDRDSQRRAINFSKLDAYARLDSPPSSKNDEAFLSIVGVARRHNDIVDNELLYAVYRNSVHLMVTEDVGIRRKAVKLGLDDRVLSIAEANIILCNKLPSAGLETSPLIHECPVHNLDLNDPFFQELRRDYRDFDSWFSKISREGRYCFVYYKNGTRIGALLIIKDETESIDSDPPLPRARRLKLCTFKVEETGFRLGELFIKISVEYARGNGIHELYLSHVNDGPLDELEKLVSTYGFRAIGPMGKEIVWLKKLVLSRDDLPEIPPTEITRIWPSFYDARDVQKLIVPIRPIWHDRLFIDFPWRQHSLFDWSELVIEGNAIEKAYLSHTPLQRIEPGAIVLFYRSVDIKAFTTLGVVTEAHLGLQDPLEIIRIVKKRTVYREDEIIKLAEKPTTVVLFTWNCYLSRTVSINELRDGNILGTAPRSMQITGHETYQSIVSRGAIDERFAIH